MVVGGQWDQQVNEVHPQRDFSAVPMFLYPLVTHLLQLTKNCFIVDFNCTVYSAVNIFQEVWEHSTSAYITEQRSSVDVQNIKKNFIYIFILLFFPLFFQTMDESDESTVLCSWFFPPKNDFRSIVYQKGFAILCPFPAGCVRNFLERSFCYRAGLATYYIYGTLQACTVYSQHLLV